MDLYWIYCYLRSVLDLFSSLDLQLIGKCFGFIWSYRFIGFPYNHLRGVLWSCMHCIWLINDMSLQWCCSSPAGDHVMPSGVCGCCSSLWSCSRLCFNWDGMFTMGAFCMLLVYVVGWNSSALLQMYCCPGLCFVTV